MSLQGISTRRCQGRSWTCWRKSTPAAPRYSWSRTTPIWPCAPTGTSRSSTERWRAHGRGIVRRRKGGAWRPRRSPPQGRAPPPNRPEGTPAMMLKHDLRLALRSFRRNPILTALTVSAIAAGIGAAMISITLYHARAGHPIWWKEHELFAVTLDARGSDHTGEELMRHPEYPPDQVTYRDAQALYRSDIPKHAVMMYRTARVVDPGKSGVKPFGVTARLTTADFFPMFDTPMRYGSGWGRAADTTPEPIVVLSSRLNDKLFNGANSVGRSITLNDRQFRVIGVADRWMPQPKFYDMTTGAFDVAEDLYLPFGWSTELKLSPNGSINCVTPSAKVGGFDSLINTDCVFMQYWVEIPDAAKLHRYQQFLDNYTNSQKQYGRFVRPTNNHLYDVPAWLERNDVVGDDSRIDVVLAIVFLAVCIVNTVGLMLA